MQGGLFESRVAATSWGGGDAGPLGGTAAILALLPLALGALAGVRGGLGRVAEVTGALVVGDYAQKPNAVAAVC